jgi:hypothetical protein
MLFGFRLQKIEFFSRFYCPNGFFSIFAPAKTGEIVAARESAFFALFLVVNLDTSQRKQERELIEDGAFIVLFVYSCTYINSGANHYSIFLFLREV